MTEQTNRIKRKLALLREADPGCKQFGARTHRYQLNPALAPAAVQAFEHAHHVQLPADYVAFLTEVGDGGAGPYYGVRSLEASRALDWDDARTHPTRYHDLGQPFPHAQPWNMTVELADLDEQIEQAAAAGDDDREEALHEQKWALAGADAHDYGRLSTCNYGCGITISLVVSGPAQGTMWTDDRADDAGLYPTSEGGITGSITFLDWYEHWLDASLAALKTA